MSPQSWEDFEIDLKLSLDGIGASLRSDDGYTIVHQIVPNGAADKDGRLKAGDRITGVGQVDPKSGERTEIVDIYEMKLSEVVRMIRGERDTKVVLRVQPKDSTETKTYDITRAKIELTTYETKGEIIDASERLGRPGKVGVIHLPSFYRDFAGAQGGVEGFKSAAADMAVYLNEFRKQGVDAVIVDMRTNTGGALSEAIEVTGHFIDQGPVVQVRESEASDARVLEDELPGTLWNGPLVLICNRMSASASEIFAGAIKDYHRGIIVGDTTTHGKGTVQNLMDVSPNQMFRLLRGTDRGKLKLTIQQFYRVNGDSTQNHGVRSDIVLPSLLDHAELGEAYLEHALPFHTIAAARFVANSLVTPEIISALQQRSEKRIAADPEFQKLTRAIDRYVERKERDSVTLNEAELRKEREKDEVVKEAEDSEGTGVEEEDAAAPDPNGPIFKKSAYNDEVLNITLDYVQTLHNRVTAKR
jgi:carboxyl-terminal processing protease